MRSSTFSKVAMRRAPLPPSGWPSAIAPPCRFTFSRSAPTSRSHARMTGANASLISTASMSASVSFERSRIARVAGIGPVSMITGSTPPSANVWKRARGRRPSTRAFSFSMTSTAAAPSVIWLELPAVMRPSGLNAGFSAPSFSIDGRAADALREAGGERRVAADVQTLLADFADAAHDHVLDQGGIDAGTLDERPQRLRGEIDGVDGVERSGLLAAPERRADGVDDDGFTHGWTSCLHSARSDALVQPGGYWADLRRDTSLLGRCAARRS